MEAMAHLRMVILRIMEPILKVVGAWKMPFGKYLTQEEVSTALSIIEIGDVLVSRNEWCLSNMFIPGWYKHVAIVARPKGDDLSGYVIEAVSPSVRSIELKKWLMSHHHVRVLRFSDPTVASRVARLSVEYIGTPYDYLVWPGANSLYCVELIGECFEEILGKIPFKSRLVWGVPTSYPDDPVQSQEFVTVFKSAKAK